MEHTVDFFITGQFFPRIFFSGVNFLRMVATYNHHLKLANLVGFCFKSRNFIASFWNFNTGTNYRVVNSWAQVLNFYGLWYSGLKFIFIRCYHYFFHNYFKFDFNFLHFWRFEIVHYDGTIVGHLTNNRSRLNFNIFITFYPMIFNWKKIIILGKMFHGVDDSI